MPSTSLALRPASTIALRTASTASARVERLEPREYSVSPMPTMQYLSFRWLMSSVSSRTRLRSIPRYNWLRHESVGGRADHCPVGSLVRLSRRPRRSPGRLRVTARPDRTGVRAGSVLVLGRAPDDVERAVHDAGLRRARRRSRHAHVLDIRCLCGRLPRAADRGSDLPG